MKTMYCPNCLNHYQLKGEICFYSVCHCGNIMVEWNGELKDLKNAKKNKEKQKKKK